MKAILHQARGRVDRPGTRVRFLARSRHCGHVWSIRAKLQLERRVRDLALFNLAIDSKLRGCDLVALRVDDVAPNGYAVDRATELSRVPRRLVGLSQAASAAGSSRAA